MTKNVRIENVGTAPYEIAVDVIEERLVDGKATDVVVETQFLRNPTDLGNFTLWQGRKLMVREANPWRR